MLVLPGLLVFLVVSSLVGTRLVLLWLRTRELPELLIGIGVLGIGPLGFGASAIGSLFAASHPGVAAPLALLGAAAATAGICSKFLFNWRVYHPGERVAARVALTGIAISLVALAASVLLGGVQRGMEIPRWYLLRGVLQAMCLLWGAAEAVFYWDKN